uniref:VANGL planar cell polarity protein 2 n=1 Tax=Eptatretus burgeri TaxID=7764 RepID=A0A8C4X2F2_EPTBU
FSACRERSRGDRRRCRERSVTIQAPEPLLEPGSREEQDDNWAETTTVVTSECSASHDDLSRLEKADGEVSRWGADSRGLRSARRRLATAACITIAVATTLSPIAFVVLPQVVVITVLPTNTGGKNWEFLRSCGGGGDGGLFNMYIYKHFDFQQTVWSEKHVTLFVPAVFVAHEILHHPVYLAICFNFLRCLCSKETPCYPPMCSSATTAMALPFIGNPGGGAEHSQAIMAAAARRRDNSHNDLYYEEAEMERRVRKRRARLVLAAEEAFTHVRSAQPAPPSPGGPMDPREAAQAVFPAVARALQKFLRATRQQGLHSMEGILRHLAFCLGHGLSARAFLEPYLVPGPSMWYGASAGLNGDWLLISSEAPSSALRPGTCFTMRQSGGLSLVVTATGLPVLRLCESPEDPKSRRFVLRLQSETSV